MRETLAFQMSAATAAIKNARSINFNGAISIKAVSPQPERNFTSLARSRATIVLRVQRARAMLTRLFVSLAESTESVNRCPIRYILNWKGEGARGVFRTLVMDREIARVQLSWTKLDFMAFVAPSLRRRSTSPGCKQLTHSLSLRLAAQSASYPYLS